MIKPKIIINAIIRQLLILIIITVFPFVVFANSNIKNVPEQPYGEYLAGWHAAIHSDLKAATEFHEKALAIDPENKMILRKAFTLFISDGKYDLALSAANKLTALGVSDSLMQVFLFLEKVKTKDYDAALQQLDNIGDAGVYGLFKPIFRSWTYLAQGKNDEAEVNITDLLASKGFKDFKKFHAGLLYDYLGKTQLAEEIYGQSLVVSGAMSLRIIEAYGILLRRLGRDQDARQLYLNYLEKAPDNATLKRALADVNNKVRADSFIKTEDDALAEVFYTVANFLMQDDIRKPAVVYLNFANYMKQDFPASDFLLGQIFKSDKYFQGALDKFAQIPRTSPLYINAQLEMAWTYEKMGQIDKAIEAMTGLSRKYPERIEILGALGDINRMNSRFEEAGKVYTKYIDRLSEISNKHWSIFYTRGIAYEQAKKWTLAEADFLKALELRPEQPQVLNYLAYSWVDKGINVERAQKMLERAAELRPYDGYIIDSLGWAMYRIGDMPKAVEYLEKAVMLQTDDWAINDHLGDAYWAVGRKYEAKFQWRHALSLKPDDELIQKIRTKIKDGKK